MNNYISNVTLNGKNYKLRSGNSEKAFILIGDSYGLKNAGWNGWGYQYANLHPEIPCFVTAVGGSGFIGDTTVNNFLKQLQNLSAEITNKQMITDIIVMGGYNDASTNRTQDQLVEALNNFRAYANENYPNAYLHFGFIAVHYNGIQPKLNTYYNIFKRICGLCGFKFMTNSNLILLNRDYIFVESGNPNSNFHPNTAGCTELAYGIDSYFSNGIHVSYGENIQSCNIYTEDRVVMLNPSAFIGQPLPNINFAFNTWVPVVSFENSKIAWFDIGSDFSFVSQCMVFDTSGNYHGVVEVKAYNNKLWAKNDFYVNGLNVNNPILLFNPIAIDMAQVY